ncbi:MAG TPA: DUF456 domain-containing protein [Anaerolineae bacterium]|nr:DUF456 domain-containing protein [Anaerolineae bacterium]HNU04638.1 DUF456 domain-containing protein [Anaerolineae bacterium]
MPALSPLALLAYLLIFVGLVGSLLPVVPGPVFIWLGALLWAANDGFQAIGWPTLLFLGLLTILAWTSDLLLTTLFSRKVGASWKAILGAILGGFVGGIFFGGWIPIVGTLVATVVGAVLGMVAMEVLDKRDLRLALRSTQGYMLAVLASSILEALLALAMILIFVWQAFLSPAA